MSGGFLGRAFGLGRTLLLRGFGGVSAAPAPVTYLACPHLTTSMADDTRVTTSPVDDLALATSPVDDTRVATTVEC